jgi:hypothetical protein
VESLCRAEFDAGNARPLVEAHGGFSEAGAEDTYSEIVERIVFREDLPLEQCSARFVMLRAEAEASVQRLHAQVERIKSLTDNNDGSSRKLVDEVAARARFHQEAGEATAAKAVVVGALTAGLVGVERVGAFGGLYSREEADAIERFGVDATGEAVKAWSLADLG